MDVRKKVATRPANRSNGRSALSPDNPAHRKGAPYWLLVRDTQRKESGHESRGVEVLSLALDSGAASGAANGRLLPVFLHEARARRFIATFADPVGSSATTGSEWRARGTGAGELLSALSGSPFSAGPCAGVERVVLDPPPELVEETAAYSPVNGSVGEAPGVSRSAFLERLMGRGRTWFEKFENQRRG